MFEFIPKEIAQSAADAQTPKPHTFPKKFFETASHQDGFLLLDGRKAKTPGKNPLHCAFENVNVALVQEWNALETEINPGKMPLTRLLNSIIDGVVPNFESVKGEILQFAASDLLCYHAASPEKLVLSQAKGWGGALEILRKKYAAPFNISTSFGYVKQSEESLSKIEELLPENPFHLGSMNTITTLTGSAFLSILMYKQDLTPEQAWELAHLEEDFQIEQWGEDDEALMRRNNRHQEFLAASLVLLAK